MIDKPGVETHNKIRVVGEPTLYILKSTGREGVARGTVEQRRGHFLVLGVQMFRIKARSGVGVHSSQIELTRLAVSISTSLVA